MRIGGQMFFTDYSMTPTELARALEERGFDSLWVPEHSHIPLTRKSPFPSGGDLPKKYYDVMDPFVVLSAAAAVTKTLLLGTGICLIAQRDPIQTAKQVASIDQVSGGRFLFGIGNGWNEDEMANHGTAFASRHRLARERVEAMKVIWTESKAEYHGEFVNFEPMMTWPKPVQKPHPPILVGGAFPYGARRALRYGNGWMPHRTRTQYADVQALLPKFREMAAEAGRDPGSVPITIWGAKENLDLLKRDRDDGVSRVVVSFDSAKADTILPELDRWATLIRQLGS
jgi:probable F420-dependent oxidoreductase